MGLIPILTHEECSQFLMNGHYKTIITYPSTAIWAPPLPHLSNVPLYPLPSTRPSSLPSLYQASPTHRALPTPFPLPPHKLSSISPSPPLFLYHLLSSSTTSFALLVPTRPYPPLPSTSPSPCPPSTSPSPRPPSTSSSPPLSLNYMHTQLIIGICISIFMPQ